MKNNAFFPLFVDISEKKIVVIGGGAIATRRVKTLLPFAPQIVVVAPEVTGELEELENEKKLTIFHREYQREDIYDAWMVLVATNDSKLNDGIYSVAKCLGALVNVASNQEKCDFHFPGVIRSYHPAVRYFLTSMVREKTIKELPNFENRSRQW